MQQDFAALRVWQQQAPQVQPHASPSQQQQQELPPVPHDQIQQQDFEQDLPRPFRRSQQMRRTTSRICGRPILMAELQNSPREVT